MTDLLHSGFLRAAGAWPDRPALHVDGQTISYEALRKRAATLAATVQRHRPVDAPPLVGVFADRSATGFAGVLGSLMAGCGYVPLNPTFPTARTALMLQRAGCRVLVADDRAVPQLPGVLEAADTAPLVLVLPEQTDVSDLARRWPQHTFIGQDALVPAEDWVPVTQPPDTPAYLLFTSGSSGVPKGVLVTHANATHFVHAAGARYGVTQNDRFSQMFDLTFDLSVFDLFVAWQAGACVCCPRRAELWNPDEFIRDQQLTVWFSVPSAAHLMAQLGVLKSGRFPSLRWSLFCGERLTVRTAAAWATAAPASTLENLYGPTELTVACTAYRWNPPMSAGESELGTVPIGYPLPGLQAVVTDDAFREVAPGEAGELLMAGPQRTPGYWRDPDATAHAHVRVPGHDELFYRTGDRVRRPANGGPLTFLGRMDQQVKVQGYRVELGEIESSLREVPGVESAVAVGWPSAADGPQGIAAFIIGRDLEPTAVRANLLARLQGYAIPQIIRVLPALPLTANGKVDRQALRALLDA
jgi:amino acid adenylation domain-containing protein